jgi:hypothetical protein
MDRLPLPPDFQFNPFADGVIHPNPDSEPRDDESAATVPSQADGLRGLVAPYGVAAFAVVLSLSSFFFFYYRGATNWYGDGIAHTNIARKVVDHPDSSLWQRYVQIGSPWLPLQTVLMLPLVANDRLWRTGVAGSIVSMASFVITALLIYLYAKRLYPEKDTPGSRLLPLLSVGIFALNPSALYLQTTPMNEVVFMAALVASAFSLQRWVDRPTSARLAIAGLVASLSTLSRYEAWPVAAFAVLVVLLTARGSFGRRLRITSIFGGLVAIGPIYWLWHNWAIYGDPLWFVTGPYSARGVWSQNQTALGWSRIFEGHPLTDFLLLLATVAVCAGPILILMSLAGLAFLFLRRGGSLRLLSPAGLLAVPFFFHWLSLYRGEIQVFPLSAFGLLNVRYGLSHLIGISLIAPATVAWFRTSRWKAAFVAAAMLVGAQYLYLVSEGPAQLAIVQEAYRNGVNTRAARDLARFSAALRTDPPHPTILMHTGALGPVVAQGGLRFSEIIHEGTIRWHELNRGIPADVNTIIIQEGDPLDRLLEENPDPASDVAGQFTERSRQGRIRLLTRFKR